MSTVQCPGCGEGIDTRGREVTCDHCQRLVRILPLCPDCGEPLERLKACGAVDYFCNRCNSLISKSRVRFDATLA
ncbi:zinc ribbon domain-containing protein [Aeromonas schubertii]|uniref:Zinc ribbon domain-containing protein n=1 Tax=Aeromonas schubertii TaxID=652 RepID=A0ABS7V6Z8_9GAMM|nr:zinc ribbon domain-containing protein [Aeromonas schubertii]MBZ6065164.1 zinc ribbon domain-containing protein [Aeromonas schubertii]